ncbi:MAG: CBS domain-containing protein [Euryarchaeota archaeon]
MPESVKVKDHMTMGVAQVPMTATVRDAIREMVDVGVHGIAVVSDAGELVGVVEEEDLMRLILDRWGEWDEILRMSVEDVMNPEPPVVEPEDPLIRALEVMREHDTTRAFVVGCEGNPVGVISVTDVLSALTSL